MKPRSTVYLFLLLQAGFVFADSPTMPECKHFINTQISFLKETMAHKICRNDLSTYNPRKCLSVISKTLTKILTETPEQCPVTASSKVLDLSEYITLYQEVIQEFLFQSKPLDHYEAQQIDLGKAFHELRKIFRYVDDNFH